MTSKENYKIFNDDELGNFYNKNVTTIIGGRNIFFNDIRIPKIVLETDLEVKDFYNAKNVGTAINILFDYELWRLGKIPEEDNPIKKLLRKELVQTTYHEKFQLQLILKFLKKEKLDIDELYVLVLHSNAYRMGYNFFNPESFKRLMEELNIELKNEKFKNDMEQYFDSVSDWMISVIGDGEVISNPVFGQLENGINADGDFIVGETLFEIKCQKSNVIASKTVKQLMMYKLLNKTLENPFKISKFGFINPLLKQVHIFDIDIPVEVEQRYDRYCKEGIFQIYKNLPLEVFLEDSKEFQYEEGKVKCSLKGHLFKPKSLKTFRVNPVCPFCATGTEPTFKKSTTKKPISKKTILEKKKKVKQKVKKIRAVADNGLGKTYEFFTIIEAAKLTSVDNRRISDYLNGKKKNYTSWLFERIEKW